MVARRLLRLSRTLALAIIRPFIVYRHAVLGLSIAATIWLLIWGLALLLTPWGAFAVIFIAGFLTLKWVLRALVFPGSLVFCRQGMERASSQSLARNLAKSLLALRAFAAALLRDKLNEPSSSSSSSSSTATGTANPSHAWAAETLLRGSAEEYPEYDVQEMQNDAEALLPASWASPDFQVVEAISKSGLLYSSISAIEAAAIVATVRRKLAAANSEVLPDEVHRFDIALNEIIQLLSSLYVLVVTDKTLTRSERGPRVPSRKSDKRFDGESVVCSLFELLTNPPSRATLSTILRLSLTSGSTTGRSTGVFTGPGSSASSSSSMTLKHVSTSESSTTASSTPFSDEASSAGMLPADATTLGGGGIRGDTSVSVPVVSTEEVSSTPSSSEAIHLCLKLIDAISSCTGRLLPLIYPRRCTVKSFLPLVRSHFAERAVGSLQHLRAEMVFRTGGMTATVETNDKKKLDGMFIPADAGAFRAAVGRCLRGSMSGSGGTTRRPNSRSVKKGRKLEIEMNRIDSDASSSSLVADEGLSVAAVTTDMEAAVHDSEWDWRQRPDLDLSELPTIDLGSLGPTVLFCNTNACYYELMLHYEEWLFFYLSRGVNVFVFNYRGFGRSAGVATASSLGPDGVSCLNFLKARGVTTFGLHGRSVGGGCATYVASKNPDCVKWLCADRTFSTLVNTAGSLVGDWSKPIVYTAQYKLDNVTNYFAAQAYKVVCCDANDTIVTDEASLKTGLAMALCGRPVHHNEPCPNWNDVRRNCIRRMLPRRDTRRGPHASHRNAPRGGRSAREFATSLDASSGRAGPPESADASSSATPRLAPVGNLISSASPAAFIRASTVPLDPTAAGATTPSASTGSDAGRGPMNYEAEGVLVIPGEAADEIEAAWTFLVELSGGDDHPDIPKLRKLFLRLSAKPQSPSPLDLTLSTSADRHRDSTSSDSPLTNIVTSTSHPSVNFPERPDRTRQRQAIANKITETSIQRCMLDAGPNLCRALAVLGFGLNAAGRCFADSLSWTQSTRKRRQSLQTFVANLQVWGSLPDIPSPSRHPDVSARTLDLPYRRDTSSFSSGADSCVSSSIGASFVKFANQYGMSVDDFVESTAPATEEVGDSAPGNHQPFRAQMLSDWTRKESRTAVAACKAQFSAAAHGFRVVAQQTILNASTSSSSSASHSSTSGGTSSHLLGPSGTPLTSFNGGSGRTAHPATAEPSATSSDVSRGCDAAVRLSSNGGHASSFTGTPGGSTGAGESLAGGGIASGFGEENPSGDEVVELMRVAVACLRVLEDFIASLNLHFLGSDSLSFENSNNVHLSAAEKVKEKSAATALPLMVTSVTPDFDSRRLGFLVPVDCGHNGSLSDAELRVIDFHLRQSGLLDAVVN